MTHKFRLNCMYVHVRRIHLLSCYSSLSFVCVFLFHIYCIIWQCSCMVTRYIYFYYYIIYILLAVK